VCECEHVSVLSQFCVRMLEFWVDDKQLHSRRNYTVDTITQWIPGTKLGMICP
jgi:hypothetical protein